MTGTEIRYVRELETAVTELATDLIGVVAVLRPADWAEWRTVQRAKFWRDKVKAVREVRASKRRASARRARGG